MSENSDENYTPTDNEMLEMSNHFKEVIDRKDKEKKVITRRYNELYKVLVVAYTIFRLADDFFADIEYPDESIFKSLHHNIEYGRQKTSEMIHKLLPSEDSDSSDLE